jgi:Putative prokaryotic signal transducing protein
MDANELVRVYTVNEPTLAELIRAELQGEGIACEVSGENQAGFSGVITIEIFVRAKDADRARKFIEQHEHRLKSEAESE